MRSTEPRYNCVLILHCTAQYVTYDFDNDDEEDYYSEELSFVWMRVISHDPDTDEIRVQMRQIVFQRLINGSPVYEDALAATNNKKEVAEWVREDSPPELVMDFVGTYDPLGRFFSIKTTRLRYERKSKDNIEPFYTVVGKLGRSRIVMGAKTVGGVECQAGKILSPGEIGIHESKPTVFNLYNAEADEGDDSHCGPNNETAKLKGDKGVIDGSHAAESKDLVGSSLFELDVEIPAS